MTLPHLNQALEVLYGVPVPRLEARKLRGDASTRSYYRVQIDDGGSAPSTLIVMQLPDDALRSDEGGLQPETNRLPFLEVGELLASRGLPVPKVYFEDLAHGLVLLEDLGDVTLESQLRCTPRSAWDRLYNAAIDLLVQIHERCADLPEDSIVQRRSFDRDLLEWELEHFREWGLEALFGELDATRRKTVSEAFSAIVREIQAMPYGFVHRDYQSRNLMIQPQGELAIIDFQDALLGPRAYDLVALLCDSYVVLDTQLQQAMIRRYAAARRIDADELLREFSIVTLHRKLKDAGRFVFIDRIRNNADFLQWYPQSLAYVGRALEQLPGFEPLERVLRTEIAGFPYEVAKPASAME